jgi:hypothetical protein
MLISLRALLVGQVSNLPVDFEAGWKPAPLLAAQEEPLLHRLDPVLRTKVFMALLGLVLLGLVLVLLVMVGGHYVRRLSRQRPGASQLDQDAWYRKPLSRPPEESEDEEP